MKSKDYDMLMYFINNGIVLADGTIKDFDIVDYYNIFNDNIVRLYERTKETAAGSNTLKSFIIKNLGADALGVGTIEGKISVRHRVKDLLKTDVTLGVQFDDNGKIIEGTGYKISEEQKTEAFDFLSRTHGTVYPKGMMTIYKRMASGYGLETKIDAKNSLNRNK